MNKVIITVAEEEGSASNFVYIILVLKNHGEFVLFRSQEPVEDMEAETVDWYIQQATDISKELCVTLTISPSVVTLRHEAFQDKINVERAVDYDK